jgi:hypothetical protein
LLKSQLVSAAQNFLTLAFTALKNSFASIANFTVNLTLAMPPKFQRRSNQPSHRSVRHPLFSRISPTTYLIKDPDYLVNTTIHVGQVAEYIHFDEQIRAHADSADFRSIPIGFIEFSNSWNDGVASGDPRRISSVFMAQDHRNSYVTPSEHPVLLKDFFITPEQTGAAPNTTNPSMDASQADITNEFAVLMAAQQKRQRKFVQERQALKTKAKSSPIYSTHTHFRKKPKHSKNPHKFPKPNHATSSSSRTSTQSTTEHSSFDTEEDTTEFTGIPEELAPGDNAFEENIPEDDVADAPVDETAPMET